MRGGVSERPKEHASKACEVQASVGSNPTATARAPRAQPHGWALGAFCCVEVAFSGQFRTFNVAICPENGAIWHSACRGMADRQPPDNEVSYLLNVAFCVEWAIDVVERG